ncbi:hypothetical protein P43SY_003438 [Pythium insidiosum]|uniref:Putative auto-transporter adhesin head GIN domain-containing protein n=1 Tax=Pythium insidiosum TaxID=114742 RepID=A0AAD5LDY2_PYTIN|nr:hypothetical protein P43SY_003438 [Pythium insidiosum]
MKTVFASSVLAFHVRPDGVQPTTEAISPAQQFQKTWTVEGDARVHQLTVSSPGLTHVSFNPDATTAAVKVSSGDVETVEAVEVIAASPGALEIRPTAKFERKHLLVEVSLPVAHTLTTLDCIGSGTVVVDDKVLVGDAPDADVRVRLTGSGDCFVTSHADVRVNSLSLDLTGSGDLQFIAPSVTARRAFSSNVTASGDVRAFIGKVAAPDVSISTTGSGDLNLASLVIDASHRFQASVRGSGEVHTVGDVLRAGRMAVSVTGSGDISIAAKDELRAEQVDGSVAGSGDVKLACLGARCDSATLQVSGSGDLDLRDLVARSASAQVVGSGDVLFRAVQQATVNAKGSGGVYLVGAPPASVTGKARHVQHKPSLVEKLLQRRSEPRKAPTPVDAFLHTTRFDGTINVRSFSDLKHALGVLWNTGKGDHIEINVGSDAIEKKAP